MRKKRKEILVESFVGVRKEGEKLQSGIASISSYYKLVQLSFYFTRSLPFLSYIVSGTCTNSNPLFPASRKTMRTTWNWTSKETATVISNRHTLSPSLSLSHLHSHTDPHVPHLAIYPINILSIFCSFFFKYTHITPWWHTVSHLPSIHPHDQSLRVLSACV